MHGSTERRTGRPVGSQSIRFLFPPLSKKGRTRSVPASESRNSRTDLLSRFLRRAARLSLRRRRIRREATAGRCRFSPSVRSGRGFDTTPVAMHVRVRRRPKRDERGAGFLRKRCGKRFDAGALGPPVRPNEKKHRFHKHSIRWLRRTVESPSENLTGFLRLLLEFLECFSICMFLFPKNRVASNLHTGIVEMKSSPGPMIRRPGRSSSRNVFGNGGTWGVKIGSGHRSAWNSTANIKNPLGGSS